jgi:hypothetical protein
MKTEALVNLKPEAGVVLSNNLTESLPLQRIDIVKVIKKVNRTDGKQDWQGYLIKFKESDVVMPISGGTILNASIKQDFDAFEVDKSDKKSISYELTATMMGFDITTKSVILKKS